MSMMSFKIDCVVGARPNFVKIAPIMRALSAKPGIVTRLIHTGQHYDFNMSDVFFQQLGMPAPDVNLQVGSGSHAQQTAHIAALAKAQADVPAAPLGDATTADEQTTLDQSDADGAQAIVTEQRVEAAAAAELAAQQAAAAQAAVQAAEAAKDHHTASTNDQGLPAGAVPPDVPGTDEPDSTACASSALTWNGTESVCD